jgi:2-C-methyl-D-erythritol 4-phosphate cytidylyltransferase
MSIGLIITSAGQSARFGKDTHKILANIHRTPLIMHTIMAFATFDEITECVITVPEELCETINTITKNVGAKFKILVISGGKTRF